MNRKKFLCVGFVLFLCAVLLMIFVAYEKKQPKELLSSEPDSEEIYNEEISTQSVEQETQTEKNMGTFVVYFSGIDVWGWTDTKSRSDVNIIAAVNTNTRHIQLINTPRDYYVEMPISNGTKDKLTHAGLYGVENSMETLSMLYDIDIDYYLRVNFSGFEAIIDEMGGVDVYSEYDFTVDPIKHYTEGYNHLTGLEALAFVRERHAFASGDNQRGRNQMALLNAMIQKVCSADFLANHDKIIEDLTDMYRTNIPDDVIAGLIFNQLLNNEAWTVDSYAVTGTGATETTYSTPDSAGYVMIPNDADVEQAKSLLQSVVTETK